MSVVVVFGKRETKVKALHVFSAFSGRKYCTKRTWKLGETDFITRCLKKKGSWTTSNVQVQQAVNTVLLKQYPSKRIKKSRGPNTGGRFYKPCSRWWSSVMKKRRGREVLKLLSADITFYACFYCSISNHDRSFLILKALRAFPTADNALRCNIIILLHTSVTTFSSVIIPIIYILLWSNSKAAHKTRCYVLIPRARYI